MTPFSEARFNGSGLAAAGAILAILLRRRAIGGWLFYFFWQVLLGLALVTATTQWRVYSPDAWASGGDYFLYLLANLPRIFLLAMTAVVWIALVNTRDWAWVCGLRYTLATYAFLTILKALVDLSYFPRNVPLDGLSLAFPLVWMVYFTVSLRVHRVFREKIWQ